MFIEPVYHSIIHIMSAIGAQEELATTTATATTTVEEPAKKRGRRKKIVTEKEAKKTSSSQSKKEGKESQLVQINQSLPPKTKNLILNLQCSLQEIDDYIRNQAWKSDEFAYDPKVPIDILPYSGNSSQDYHVLGDSDDGSSTVISPTGGPVATGAYSPTIATTKSNTICAKCEKEMNLAGNQNSSSMMMVKNHSTKEDLTDKDIQKVKELKIQFYKQIIPEKKVDCFWCTCPYDNDSFHILQHGSEGNIIAHGSYCSPSCAVAYLFKHMHWDDSAILESYQLMNHYYSDPSKPMSKQENIKPACSPFFTLDKYYGTLTIQEYRKLSNSNYMLLCLEKPVSRVLPEIHEDNDKMMTSQSIRGNYKVKKQSEKSGTTNRNDILKSNFGV
jgi:hypothetical protein